MQEFFFIIVVYEYKSQTTDHLISGTTDRIAIKLGTQLLVIGLIRSLRNKVLKTSLGFAI